MEFLLTCNLWSYVSNYSIIWSLLETVIVCSGAALFFFDPIRRWNFFGYRPTAIMALFDPKIGKVLLVKKECEPWYAFSQGGIYNPDLNFSSKEILRRELGLNDTRFSLRYTQTLGKVRIPDREYSKRPRINTISIVRNLRGKGYIACYVRTDLQNIDKDISLGEDISEYRLAGAAEAKRLMLGQTSDNAIIAKSLNQKQKLLLKALDEIEHILANTTPSQDTPVQEKKNEKEEK